MHYDKDGFLYPQIDINECSNCGLCKRICPVNNNKNQTKKPLDIFAAFNNNEDIRLSSSSGGLFSLFAEWVLDSGGIVYGAAFDKEWDVSHISVETIENLSKLRGSKYIQSNVGDSFSQAEKELKKGRLVLFTGTPCQIAGLQAFLRQHYDNLILIDILCHGVPSTRVFHTYIQERAHNKKIDYINMRSKRQGWKNYHFDINDYSKSWNEDTFMRAFLNNLILRPSCYSCLYKDGKTFSDISLGDFWGVKQCHKELDDDKGISIVLLNTEKGKELFDKIGVTHKTRILLNEASIYNSGLTGLVKPHKNRSKFFKELQSAPNVTVLMERLLKPSIWKHIKYTIATHIYKLLHIR